MRKAVVVIPPHHELRKRVSMRSKDMGDPVPDDALNAMKGQFEPCVRGGGGGGRGEEREKEDSISSIYMVCMIVVRFVNNCE